MVKNDDGFNLPESDECSENGKLHIYVYTYLLFGHIYSLHFTLFLILNHNLSKKKKVFNLIR